MNICDVLTEFFCPVQHLFCGITKFGGPYQPLKEVM